MGVVAYEIEFQYVAGWTALLSENSIYDTVCGSFYSLISRKIMRFNLKTWEEMENEPLNVIWWN